MSNKPNNNWNTVNKKPPYYHSNQQYRKHFDDSVSNRIIVSDDFRKELFKNDINVDKWYHKLLTGQFYKSNGAYFYEEPILKRLANEYQKALHIKNIDTLVLIKNELFNHLPEPVWIYKYLNGDVCDAQGKSYSKINGEIEAFSSEFIDVYNRAKEETMI